MSIKPNIRIPRGKDVQKTKYHGLFDFGPRPTLQTFVAYYQPVTEEDRYHELMVALEAGLFVSFDRTVLNSGNVDNNLWLVPANGGEEQDIVYTALDVDFTLDVDELESGTEKVVAAAGTATKKQAANLPAGVLEHKAYHKAHEKVDLNVAPQPNIAFRRMGIYEVPLLFDEGASGTPAGQDQSDLESGDLVKPGPLGWPVKFVADGSGADSIEQLCGRAIHVKKIQIKGALDKVHTVPGFDLPGTGTGGRDLHEFVTLHGSSDLVDRKVRVALLL